jgi:hypothetical protein
MLIIPSSWGSQLGSHLHAITAPCKDDDGEDPATASESLTLAPWSLQPEANEPDIPAKVTEDINDLLSQKRNVDVGKPISVQKSWTRSFLDLLVLWSTGELAMSSVKTLKAASWATAAGPSSPPESSSDPRQWDHIRSWLRDSCISFCTNARLHDTTLCRLVTSLRLWKHWNTGFSKNTLW